VAGELVVFGSLNFDLVLPVGTLPGPGQTVLGGDLRRYAGGKGANQAVAAAQLGAPVRLVGRVGADAEGSFLLAEAAAAGVDVSGVLVDPGTTTGHALILVDGHGENIIAVAPGANARPDHTDAARAAGRLGPGDTLICQLEVPVPAVAAAVRAAHAAGALVVLNAAPAVAVPAALLADVDILVVNESEARAIGTAAPAALAARTGCAVVVTLGSDGAAYAEPDGGRAGSAPSYPVDVVDTTGAGDVFVAGLALARHQGADLPEAVAFAVAAGALAVTAPGARAADLSPARVHRLMRRP
jgi:ribokinase